MDSNRTFPAATDGVVTTVVTTVDAADNATTVPALERPLNGRRAVLAARAARTVMVRRGAPYVDLRVARAPKVNGAFGRPQASPAPTAIEREVMARATYRALSGR